MGAVLELSLTSGAPLGSPPVSERPARERRTPRDWLPTARLAPGGRRRAAPQRSGPSRETKDRILRWLFEPLGSGTPSTWVDLPEIARPLPADVLDVDIHLASTDAVFQAVDRPIHSRRM